MSTTTPSSALLPNPDALHKVFDAEFQGLLSQARQELGEAISLAPRVAEGAFVRAWDARARFQTMEQLKQFLRDDVKSASARALARRTAIQQQSGDGGQISLRTAEHVAAATAVDPKVSWSHIVAAIHLDPQSAHTDKMSAESLRHDTAERLDHATRTGLSPKVALAIGAAIVIVALAGVMFVNRMSSELAIANAMSSTNGKVTATGYGKKGNMTLNEGTEVTLAPDSKLFVPADFGAKLRPVKLDGAAAFKVAQGEGEFRVYMRNAVIMAHGTSFVVSGRWSDTAVIVKVTEGSVGVRVGKESATEVTAGQTKLVDANGVIRDATPDEAEEAGSWAEDKLTMINRPLREILPQLLRWYNVDVSVRDLKLLERPATLRASLESGTAALLEVAKSAGLTVTMDGGRTVLVDPAALKLPANKK